MSVKIKMLSVRVVVAAMVYAIENCLFSFGCLKIAIRDTIASHLCSSELRACAVAHCSHTCYKYLKCFANTIHASQSIPVSRMVPKTSPLSEEVNQCVVNNYGFGIVFRVLSDTHRQAGTFSIHMQKCVRSEQFY